MNNSKWERESLGHKKNDTSHDREQQKWENEEINRLNYICCLMVGKVI